MRHSPDTGWVAVASRDSEGDAPLTPLQNVPPKPGTRWRANTF
jgi:hypothetical protein